MVETRRPRRGCRTVGGVSGDEEIGRTGRAARQAKDASVEAAAAEKPTSKVVDAIVVVALGVLVALSVIVVGGALDVFAWPDAALLIVVLAVLGAVPVAVALGALARWHVFGAGRTIARLSLGALGAFVILLVVFGTGLVPRARIAVSAGGMDAAAETLIARHGGKPSAVAEPGPVDIGWLTMSSSRVVSCTYSTGPADTASDDPGVLFEDGFERRLLYCRNHTDSQLRDPGDVEMTRDTAITHLGGSWYVITEAF